MDTLSRKESLLCTDSNFDSVCKFFQALLDPELYICFKTRDVYCETRNKTIEKTKNIS